TGRTAAVVMRRTTARTFCCLTGWGATTAGCGDRLMTRWLNYLTNAFPIWVVLGGIAALIHPPLFTWFSNKWITWGLAVIMLGMGITLSVDDFKGVMKMPRAVAAGYVAQYMIMPCWGGAGAAGLNIDTA